jgi:hypothetical protein
MSEKNKKSRKLEKDIVAYSLAAGAVLIGAAGANAAVHHTDLGAGVVLNTDGATIDIDFDGGGTEFTIAFGTSYRRVNVAYRTANASWRGGNGYGTTGAIALNNGDNVDSGAQWGHSNLTGTNSFGNMAYTSYNLGYGSFAGTSDKYLGVRFTISGNTHYGWIQVQVPADVTYATITGYAYEDVADAQITAGAIPEPGSLALLAIGAAGLAAWRKKRN